MYDRSEEDRLIKAYRRTFRYYDLLLKPITEFLRTMGLITTDINTAESGALRLDIGFERVKVEEYLKNHPELTNGLNEELEIKTDPDPKKVESPGNQLAGG